MDYAAMGKKISRQRQRIGLTQMQLAERANLSSSFIGHIERGTRIPSIETMDAIAHALNVSIATLWPEDSAKFIPPMKQDELPAVFQLIIDALRIVRAAM